MKIILILYVSQNFSSAVSLEVYENKTIKSTSEDILAMFKILLEMQNNHYVAVGTHFGILNLSPGSLTIKLSHKLLYGDFDRRVRICKWIPQINNPDANVTQRATGTGWPKNCIEHKDAIPSPLKRLIVCRYLLKMKLLDPTFFSK